ncbi:unnamed protein product [Caenorhabditis angaria]|uniref:VWFA domain-containing protein n=1 Tax=Caenorhabditis angaria TaxID=860376 RepID=A0A9P1J7B1_9PELO|nr:unnamed protein product [Caenorhabditis angaria]
MITRVVCGVSRQMRNAGTYLRIGSVRVPRRDAKNPDLVPAYYGITKQPPDDILPHLKWLIQKDLLKQDVFLLGVPGKLRLEIVLRYLEATNREFEYLSITRDTTEADIKQRREIKDGTAYYTDLCAVRAALSGRVLVIDGVERAERNVLPILNNLLENREMQLDDGRFLMKHDKYDELKEKYDEATLKKMGIERVSENFHVIALGLPVPRFPGNTLDPPFRSRFQCRNIEEYSFQTFLSQAAEIAPNVAQNDLNDLISLIYAFNTETSSSRPRIAISVVEHCLNIWNSNPSLSAGEIVNMCYPAKEILTQSEKDLIDQFKKKFELSVHEKPRKIVSVEDQKVKISGDVEVTIPKSSHHSSVSTSWVETEKQETLLADLAVSFSKGDFVLIGPKGSGKSRILNELSKRLNFEYSSMVLHQDMNTRELIQRRHMKENGDTIWEDSQLVKAARNGDVCVLDGVEMVHPSVLMSLAQFIYHRRFDLPNGNRLVGAEEFERLAKRNNVSTEELNKRGVFKIPDSFRLLFVGESQSKEHKWINENILSMLPFHTVPWLSLKEQENIILQMTDNANQENVKRLIQLVENLRKSPDTGMKNIVTSLSLRRLIHIAKRDQMQPGHLKELVEKAALSKFLPQLTRETFEHELNEIGIINDESIRLKNDGSYLSAIRAPTEKAEDEALIPNVLFHENAQHREVLEDMARDMKLGSHLLLIGNQGVGKNKITDRFLHLINRPRQYMQLHRDTTVQTLTIQTVVENGIIRHEDSSLVKAARNGQILVIDEADKAPLHVIAILKSLLDTGVLVLGDGRTLKPAASILPEDANNSSIVPIHPNFRILMLANRPGFPFLGNNLFAVLGDLFAIHMIDHPNRESELEMIKKYGPNVPSSTLNKLLTIFNELRTKTDQGLLQYPYSTRELVNIVRHCNEFPDDPLTEVARNVFDFDSFRVHKSERHVLLAQRTSIGDPVKIGNWSFKRIELPKSFSFNKPQPVKITNVKHLPHRSLALGKSSKRNEMFSEQVCKWDLPIGDDNVVSDGLRVGDDLIVATVNPPKLYWTKNFMEANTTEEIDFSNLIPRPVSFHSAVTRYIPKFRLGHLNSEQILIHEETSDKTVIIDLADKTGGTVKSNQTIGDQISAIFSAYRTPSRLAPSNEGSALLYERDRNDLEIFSIVNNVPSVQNGSVPFNIKRAMPIDKNHWMLVSTENESYSLSIGEDMFELAKLESDLDGGIDAIATKMNENEMFMVSDPYYFLKGKVQLDGSNIIEGSHRKPIEDRLIPKRTFYFSDENVERNIDTSREVLFLGNNVIRSRSKFDVPKDALPKEVYIKHVAGFLETVDTETKQLSYVLVPSVPIQNFIPDFFPYFTQTGFVLVPWSDDEILTINWNGGVTSYELGMSSIAKSFGEWKRMTDGEDEKKLRMDIEKNDSQFDKSKLDRPKKGKVDKNNTPHHGGNTWMGGTGGYNTAGLGGVGGPFRLDAGHDVHQQSDYAKKQVPGHILKKAREIAKQEYDKKLRQINMSEYDAEQYDKIWNNVQRNSKKLSAVIDQLEAKKKEREWAKHQTSGDLDDGKLIEGVTGEQNIYRRRIDKEPDPGAPQTKPKRLKLCFDVSGSMYRFNGYDKRLQRSLETALMMMVSLEGKTDKIEYDIIGHSGDSPAVKFVDKESYPKNNRERLNILKKMLAHTQYCMSGDNTVECVRYAVKELSKKDDYDETVVILVSDANLQRYGIQPKELKEEMIKEPTVNCFVVFIGSLGEQAERLLEELPSGKSFVLKDSAELPKIMETIFASTIAQ